MASPVSFKNARSLSIAVCFALTIHPAQSHYLSHLVEMNHSFRPLILAGGKSTRMGTSKHLLQLPDGTPLYQHQINILRQACPNAPAVYISLARDSPLDATLRQLKADINVQIIYDQNSNATEESGGPAQGLVAAYAADQTATWLVVAVDYPLMAAEALQRLIGEYEQPVTCFRNAAGFCEPLVGIWSPEALRRLQERGPTAGPAGVVKQLGGRQIEVQAGKEDVLRNVNTWAEWEEVSRLLRQ